jgi:protein phosphatase
MPGKATPRNEPDGDPAGRTPESAANGALSGAAIAAAAVTHPGLMREDNQDAVRVCKPDDAVTALVGHLYAVADGMGGYAHGGVASTVAIDTFTQTVASGARPALAAPQIQGLLRRGAQDANLAVYQAAQRLNAGRMGTTLTAFSILYNTLTFVHVGDTRLYLIRGNQATCLTQDHSTVAGLVRMKVLSPDKVRKHAQRSQLEKCLGVNLFIQPDVASHTLRPGDIAILCTDGIWAVIEDAEFAQLAAAAPDPAALGQTLIDLAMERESDDNVSAVVVQVQKLAENPAQAGPLRSWGLGGVLSRLSGRS